MCVSVLVRVQILAIPAFTAFKIPPPSFIFSIFLKDYKLIAQLQVWKVSYLLKLLSK